jgi:hypothetical protein
MRTRSSIYSVRLNQSFRRMIDQIDSRVIQIRSRENLLNSIRIRLQNSLIMENIRRVTNVNLRITRETQHLRISI